MPCSSTTIFPSVAIVWLPLSYSPRPLFRTPSSRVLTSGDAPSMSSNQVSAKAKRFLGGPRSVLVANSL
eukprot:10185009-Ditylum_brightwellii.AAC.1